MPSVTITDKQSTENGWRFTVVTPAHTTHQIDLSQKYYKQLSAGTIEPEEVVVKSFVFLLDNELASAILSAFGLRKIEDYFPRFKAELFDY